MGSRLEQLGRRVLKPPARRWLQQRLLWPAIGRVRFGDLRRVKPISRVWGSERGRPIDRYYIEQFLGAHAGDICGQVLEIGSDMYTRLFGGERVTQIDVLHVAEAGPAVTIVGDLTSADQIPSERFDCVILTQTLQFIYDVPAALTTVHRILKPGGVVLATMPGMSQISRYDMDRWGHYWSFTSRSARRLFEAAFPASTVDVQAHGNVLAAIAFLHGLACRELRPHELDHSDPDYQVIITVRAAKSGA